MSKTKYRMRDGVMSKIDVRPAKKSLKRFLKMNGINIPKHKKAMRSSGNKKNANWL